MTKEELVSKAIEALDLSYSPYSHFKVGAALLTSDGEVYLGANIENAAYGSTLCAERYAIFQAYCRGYRKDDIEALAIVGDGHGLISPCGACRQVFSELLAPDTPVILGSKTRYEVTCTRELMPRTFTGDNL